MSEEKEGLQLLIEYAQQTKREAQFTEKDMSMATPHRQFMHARTLWFPDKPKENRIFAAYSNPKIFGFQSVYSGVFIPIKASKDTQLMVRQKIIFDRITSMFGSKIRFNNKKLDRKMIITGTVSYDRLDILHNAKMQNALYSFINKTPRYRIVINDLFLDFVPQLKNQSYLGLVRMGWDTDEKIEELFEAIKPFEQG